MVYYIALTHGKVTYTAQRHITDMTQQHGHDSTRNTHGTHDTDTRTQAHGIHDKKAHVTHLAQTRPHKWHTQVYM